MNDPIEHFKRELNRELRRKGEMMRGDLRKVKLLYLGRGYKVEDTKMRSNLLDRGIDPVDPVGYFHGFFPLKFNMVFNRDRGSVNFDPSAVAIVEFEDGSIWYVSPNRIQFIS